MAARATPCPRPSGSSWLGSFKTTSSALCRIPAVPPLADGDFISRYQVPLKFPPQHPLRSVDAGRLLCAFPDQLRSRLAHALYRAYWVDSSNISNHATLIRIAKSLRIPKGKLGFEIDETIFNDQRWADRLRQNTEEAHNHGAFGVPW